MNKSKLQKSLVEKSLWLRFVVISLGVFFLDIFTKFLFKKDFFQTTNHFVDITFVQNIGTMWSLFDSVQAINIVFIIVSFLALGLLVFIFKSYFPKNFSSKLKNNALYFAKNFALSFGLISAGILGNLCDRIFRGFVVDWINFHFYPVFNIADSAIVVGVLLSIYFLITYKDN